MPFSAPASPAPLDLVQPLGNTAAAPALAHRLEALMKAGIAAGTATDAEPLMELAHAFIPGGYARQLWRPKGALIVGKTHRHPCFNFLMTGELTIWTDGEARTVKAPAFWVSSGSVKRVTLAHEDSLLITVHATAETDLDKIEEALIVADSEPLLMESLT